MIRTSTWEHDFNEFITHAGFMDFGANLPCAFYAAAGVQAVTGQDVIPELRGKRNLAKALRAHQGDGEAYLVSVLDEKFEPRPLAFAQRGDVLMHQGALGLCVGAEAAFLADGDEPGLLLVPVLECEKAWAI